MARQHQRWVGRIRAKPGPQSQVFYCKGFKESKHRVNIWPSTGWLTAQLKAGELRGCGGGGIFWAARRQ